MIEESPYSQQEQKNISCLGYLFIIVALVCDVSKEGSDDEDM